MDGRHLGKERFCLFPFSFIHSIQLCLHSSFILLTFIPRLKVHFSSINEAALNTCKIYSFTLLSQCCSLQLVAIVPSIQPTHAIYNSTEGTQICSPAYLLASLPSPSTASLHMSLSLTHTPPTSPAEPLDTRLLASFMYATIFKTQL